MSYTHNQVFGTGSAWQNTGYTLTEPALVIPLSALSATWGSTPSYENAQTETGTATLHRILTGPCVTNCTQAAYDQSLTPNLIVKPATYESFAVVDHVVGTTSQTEQSQNLTVSFFKVFNTTVDSNDY